MGIRYYKPTSAGRRQGRSDPNRVGSRQRPGSRREGSGAATSSGWSVTGLILPGTVLVADTSAFLAALILYVLTVGPVRGFAFFLGLSTLLDLATAYFFTRPMVVLLGRNRLFTEARWLGVARGLAAAPAGGTTA